MNPLHPPITLVTKIPPEYSALVDYLMDGPTLTIVHPIANKALLQLSTFLPPAHNPPDMLVTLAIPMEIAGPMKALSKAFVILMPNVPLHVSDKYPNFPMFNMSLKIMIWNVQGIGNKLAVLRELIRINDPSILALVETHISGEQAQKICDRIGFSGQFRVEAQGFSGGIWLFLRQELIEVTVLDNQSQHITVEIKKEGRGTMDVLGNLCESRFNN
uniref:Uncharacterized protein n=1 Tax=Chenopodium quinoa TaxID=63459 RepID=A0A803NEW3_CHEQI